MPSYWVLLQVPEREHIWSLSGEADLPFTRLAMIPHSLSSDCWVSHLLSHGWLVRFITSRARDTAVDGRRACPHTARTERWAIACRDSQIYSTLIALVPLVLQRQPVLLVALLWHSLLVACWGMSGQATQICLETGVSGWKDTGASGWPELCISVAQQLLYMSMTAAFLAQFYHFYLLSSRGLFS